MAAGGSVVERLDAFQRRHRVVGFPLAVVYKFVDDGGTYQAALLTYYGFVSLFPLLLLAVTVLGFVLAGNPAAQQAILDSALRQVPVLGDQIGGDVHSLHGSVAALVVGIVTSLYGGLGVARAALGTMSVMWAVPVAERPGMATAYARGLLVLVVLALGVLVTTGLSSLITLSGAAGPLLRVGSVVLAVAVNTALVLVFLRLLTPARVALRQLLPGAVAAAIGWQVLQLAGTYLIEHVLAGSSASYGVFGIVLGLLGWIYLAAIVVLISAEINVVRVLRLAPRSLLSVVDPQDEAVTAGDLRAYTAYADTQRYKTFQRVDVAFDTDPGGVPAQRSAPDPTAGDGGTQGARRRST